MELSAEVYSTSELLFKQKIVTSEKDPGEETHLDIACGRIIACESQIDGRFRLIFGRGPVLCHYRTRLAESEEDASEDTLYIELDEESCNEFQVLDGRNTEILKMAFSRSGEKLALLTARPSLHIVSLSSGETIYTYHLGEIPSFAWIQETSGEKLMFSIDKKLYFEKLLQDREEFTVSAGEIEGVCVSSDMMYALYTYSKLEGTSTSRRVEVASISSPEEKLAMIWDESCDTLIPIGLFENLLFLAASQDEEYVIYIAVVDSKFHIVSKFRTIDAFYVSESHNQAITSNDFLIKKANGRSLYMLASAFTDQIIFISVSEEGIPVQLEPQEDDNTIEPGFQASILDILFEPRSEGSDCDFIINILESSGDLSLYTASAPISAKIRRSAVDLEFDLEETAPKPGGLLNTFMNGTSQHIQSIKKSSADSFQWKPNEGFRGREEEKNVQFAGFGIGLANQEADTESEEESDSEVEEKKGAERIKGAQDMIKTGLADKSGNISQFRMGNTEGLNKGISGPFGMSNKSSSAPEVKKESVFGSKTQAPSGNGFAGFGGRLGEDKGKVAAQPSFSSLASGKSFGWGAGRADEAQKTAVANQPKVGFGDISWGGDEKKEEAIGKGGEDVKAPSMFSKGFESSKKDVPSPIQTTNKSFGGLASATAIGREENVEKTAETSKIPEKEHDSVKKKGVFSKLSGGVFGIGKKKKGEKEEKESKEEAEADSIGNLDKKNEGEAKKSVFGSAIATSSTNRTSFGGFNATPLTGTAKTNAAADLSLKKEEKKTTVETRPLANSHPQINPPLTFASAPQVFSQGESYNSQKGSAGGSIAPLTHALAKTESPKSADSSESGRDTYTGILGNVQLSLPKDSEDYAKKKTTSTRKEVTEEEIARRSGDILDIIFFEETGSGRDEFSDMREAAEHLLNDFMRRIYVTIPNYFDHIDDLKGKVARVVRGSADYLIEEYSSSLVSLQRTCDTLLTATNRAELDGGNCKWLLESASQEQHVAHYANLYKDMELQVAGTAKRFSDFEKRSSDMDIAWNSVKRLFSMENSLSKAVPRSYSILSTLRKYDRLAADLEKEAESLDDRIKGLQVDFQKKVAEESHHELRAQKHENLRNTLRKHKLLHTGPDQIFSFNVASFDDIAEQEALLERSNDKLVSEIRELRAALPSSDLISRTNADYPQSRDFKYKDSRMEGKGHSFKPKMPQAQALPFGGSKSTVSSGLGSRISSIGNTEKPKAEIGASAKFAGPIGAKTAAGPGFGSLGKKPSIFEGISKSSDSERNIIGSLSGGVQSFGSLKDNAAQKKDANATKRDEGARSQPGSLFGQKMTSNGLESAKNDNFSFFGAQKKEKEEEIDKSETVEAATDKSLGVLKEKSSENGEGGDKKEKGATSSLWNTQPAVGEKAEGKISSNGFGGDFFKPQAKPEPKTSPLIAGKKEDSKSKFGGFFASNAAPLDSQKKSESISTSETGKVEKGESDAIFGGFFNTKSEKSSQGTPKSEQLKGNTALFQSGPKADAADTKTAGSGFFKQPSFGEKGKEEQKKENTSFFSSSFLDRSNLEADQAIPQTPPKERPEEQQNRLSFSLKPASIQSPGFGTGFGQPNSGFGASTSGPSLGATGFGQQQQQQTIGGFGQKSGFGQPAFGHSGLQTTPNIPARQTPSMGGGNASVFGSGTNFMKGKSPDHRASFAATQGNQTSFGTNFQPAPSNDTGSTSFGTGFNANKSNSFSGYR